VQPDIVCRGGCQVCVLRILCRKDVNERKKQMNRYAQEAINLAELVTKKQITYGDSFGQSKRILEVLYPKGISPEQYQDAMAMIRIIDKLFRIANKKFAFEENPWQDIAGYALLSLVHHLDNQEK
jgi:hypothetical protein